MVQRLTDIRINRVSLVDKGANGRVFALLKRAGAPNVSARNVIRKDVPPTFAQLMATDEIRAWLWPSLDTLGQVVSAAIAAADEDPDLRLNAVRVSAAQFSDKLLELVAGAIVSETPTVQKRARRWRGLL